MGVVACCGLFRVYVFIVYGFRCRVWVVGVSFVFRICCLCVIVVGCCFVVLGLFDWFSTGFALLLFCCVYFIVVCVAMVCCCGI